MSDDQDEDKLLKDATHSSATVYGPTVRRSSTVRIKTDEIANLKRIASQHSQRSKRRSSVHTCTVSTVGDGDSLGRITDNDPAINPQGPEFDLEKWLKWVIKGARENGMSSSRAGIVFKNLNYTYTDVRGSATAKIYPKLILKDFNGLLASGQLLLVLGRPGAGCSTFLKTLCGEVYGLDVDKKSFLHYNVSQSRMMKEFKGEVVYNQEIDKQSALPGFWMFMYRLSPFTYWTGGMTATQLHGRQVVCSTEELTIFDPPSGQTCQQYLGGMLETAGGQLMNPDATKDCNYCSLSVADEYMASVGIYWTDRWRNFGLLWVFIVFNIFMATVLYYFFRIRQWSPGMLLEKVAKK